jgi:hypothetical protein
MIGNGITITDDARGRPCPLKKFAGTHFLPKNGVALDQRKRSASPFAPAAARANHLVEQRGFPCANAVEHDYTVFPIC